MLILGYLCACIKWYHKYQKLTKSAYHLLHCDPSINLGWVRSDPIYFLMSNLDAGCRFRLAEETLTRISHPKLYTYKWTSARKLHSLFSRPFLSVPFLPPTSSCLDFSLLNLESLQHNQHYPKELQTVRVVGTSVDTMGEDASDRWQAGSQFLCILNDLHQKNITMKMSLISNPSFLVTIQDKTRQDWQLKVTAWNNQKKSLKLTIWCRAGVE